MSSTWQIIEGMPQTCLNIINSWLHRHLENQEDNLMHAKRHGDNAMIAHYIGEIDRCHCLISEVQFELMRQERAMAKRIQEHG